MAADQAHRAEHDSLLNPRPETLSGEEPLSRTSAKEFERALTACDFPLVVWDADGRIRLANQLAADLVGATLGNMAGRELFDFVVPLEGATKVVEAIAAGTLEMLRSKNTARHPGHGRAWEVRGHVAPGRLPGMAISAHPSGHRATSFTSR
jgi:PAS domain-containing protein